VENKRCADRRLSEGKTLKGARLGIPAHRFDVIGRIAKQPMTCGAPGHVCYGPWLRENAETIGDDRRSYSSKTVPAHKRESALNFKSA
jgi:hypothetical protein